MAEERFDLGFELTGLLESLQGPTNGFRGPPFPLDLPQYEGSQFGGQIGMGGEDHEDSEGLFVPRELSAEKKFGRFNQ